MFGIIVYRGFCLGYTISAYINVLGIEKGLTFLLSDLLLQNLIFIPAIIAISVSCCKLYKSIIQDKKEQNVKKEMFRHTGVCIFMLIFLAISSFVETFISNNILKILIKYL